MCIRIISYPLDRFPLIILSVEYNNYFIFLSYLILSYLYCFPFGLPFRLSFKLCFKLSFELSFKLSFGIIFYLSGNRQDAYPIFQRLQRSDVLRKAHGTVSSNLTGTAYCRTRRKHDRLFQYLYVY